jgi:hypothetical protein
MLWSSSVDRSCTASLLSGPLIASAAAAVNGAAKIDSRVSIRCAAAGSRS